MKIERQVHDGIPFFFASPEQKMAGPESVITAGDILYVQGAFDQVNKFVFDFQLNYAPQREREQLVSRKIGIVEVLLTPDSGLVDQNL